MTNIDIQQIIEIPEKIPMLPIRGIVAFPHMMMPLFVGREKSIKAIEAAIAGDRMIFLTAQKEMSIESPSPSELYTIGTVCAVMRMMKVPDDRMKVLVQGLVRAKMTKVLQSEPFYRVEIDAFPDIETTDSPEVQTLTRNVKEQVEKLASLGEVISPENVALIKEAGGPGKVGDLAVACMRLKVEPAQNLLENVDPVQRLLRVNDILSKEIEITQKK